MIRFNDIKVIPNALADGIKIKGIVVFPVKVKLSK